MGVLNDYVCQAHGRFEAYSAVCPYGCAKRFVAIEFNQAPAIRGAKTTNTDKNLRALAADYGMTDLRNDPKAGTSVMQEMAKKNEFAAHWGAVPHSAPGFSARKDAATVSPAAFGVQADSQIAPGKFKAPVPKMRVDPRGTSDLQ